MKQTITITNGTNNINFHADNGKYWMTAKVGVFTMFDPNYARLTHIDLANKAVADSAYRKLQNIGYRRVERAVAAPKKTLFSLGPEGRKIWATEYKRLHRLAVDYYKDLKGKEFQEAMIRADKMIRTSMKEWENDHYEEFAALING